MHDQCVLLTKHYTKLVKNDRGPVLFITIRIGCFGVDYSEMSEQLDMMDEFCYGPDAFKNSGISHAYIRVSNDSFFAYSLLSKIIFRICVMIY